VQDELEVAEEESPQPEKRKPWPYYSSRANPNARIDVETKGESPGGYLSGTGAVAMQPDVGGEDGNRPAIGNELINRKEAVRRQPRPFEELLLAKEEVAIEAGIEDGREAGSVGG
jgi:hypothetical protein